MSNFAMRDISSGFANMCSFTPIIIINSSNPLLHHRPWMRCNLGSSPWRRSSIAVKQRTTTMKWASCGKCFFTASISHRSNSDRPIARHWSTILTFAILTISAIASCGLRFSRQWLTGRVAIRTIITTTMPISDERGASMATTTTSNNNNNPILPIQHGGHYSDIPLHMPSSPTIIKLPTLFNKKYNNFNQPSWNHSHLSWAYPVLTLSRNIPY